MWTRVFAGRDGQRGKRPVEDELARLPVGSRGRQPNVSRAGDPGAGTTGAKACLLAL